MTEPTWLVEARQHVGLREIPGRAHAPTITRWLTDLKAWWRDDETPWCGVFVAHCLRTAGIALPVHWYRAKAYLDWGTPLILPVLGSVVVFERKGGGHVGFVVGVDEEDRLMVLGGNQGNAVSIAPFDRDRIPAYRWPKAASATPWYATGLPLLASNGRPASSNEA